MLHSFLMWLAKYVFFAVVIFMAIDGLTSMLMNTAHALT